VSKTRKILFKGTFNLRGEVHILYCHAYDCHQAWRLFCHQLARLAGKDSQWMMREFNGKKDNYKIEEEKK